MYVAVKTTEPPKRRSSQIIYLIIYCIQFRYKRWASTQETKFISFFFLTTIHKMLSIFKINCANTLHVYGYGQKRYESNKLIIKSTFKFEILAYFLLKLKLFLIKLYIRLEKKFSYYSSTPRSKSFAVFASSILY